MATPSDAGLFTSDGPSRAGASTPKQRNYQRGSSARPRGPPSESLAAPSDDEGEGFADDQIPGRRRRGDPSTIPRVEDRIGITVQEHFESFIEESVSCANKNMDNSTNNLIDFLKTLPLREPRLQVPSRQTNTT